jgi:hypothetical protein
MPQKRKRRSGIRSARRRVPLPLLAAALLAIGIALVAVLATQRDPSVSNASAPAEWSATPHSGGPRLAVDQREVDYGSVAYGEPVSAVYRLRNVGDEPVVIAQPTVVTLEGC